MPYRSGAAPVRHLRHWRRNGNDEAGGTLSPRLPFVRLLLHMAQGQDFGGMGIPDTLYQERRGRNRVHARQAHRRRRWLGDHPASQRMAPLPPQSKDGLERSLHRHRRQLPGTNILKTFLQRTAYNHQSSANRANTKLI